MSLSYHHLSLDVQLGVVTGVVGLLLSESDVGVHQAACNTATPTNHTHMRKPYTKYSKKCIHLHIGSLIIIFARIRTGFSEEML